MSLIKCPECGHTVSTQAPTCPECGIPIAGNIKRCPVCNTCVLMNASECPQCHTAFIVEEEDAEAPAPNDEAQKEKATSQEGVAQPPRQVALLQELPKPEAPKKEEKKSHAFWYVLLVIILVLAAIWGFAYWQNSVSERVNAEQAYALLQNCNDPQNYEDFIARYPGSEHLADVQKRLKELEEKEKSWTDIAHSTDIAKLRAFASANPTSPHRQTALQRIDSLEWREAEAQGTSAAYTAYIEQHQEGNYVTDAYVARDAALRREIQARNDSIAAAQDSIMAATATPEAVQP